MYTIIILFYSDNRDNFNIVLHNVNNNINIIQWGLIARYIYYNNVWAI